MTGLAVSAGTAVVSIRSVSKHFGAFKAVDQVSFDVASGTFVTLLGPSGCGKTTTLRMIGGLELPDAGVIEVAGRPVTKYRNVDRQTRMVFQSYALFPHMTVAENVAYGLRTKGVAKAEIAKRVGDILEIVDLTGKTNQHPRQLSGGQQQRVALARALVTEPLVLLLDEPLGALDLKMRKRMQIELKELQKRLNITFIYVTHDQEEALTLSDTIVVMDHGKVAQIGKPDQIYDDPASTYVADFIGTANILPAQVISSTGSEALLRLGSTQAVARAHATLAAGQSASAVIRPEHIKLVASTGGASGPGPASTGLTGTVEDVSFVGTARRYMIRTALGRITAEAPTQTHFEISDEVSLAWKSEHLLALGA